MNAKLLLKEVTKTKPLSKAVTQALKTPDSAMRYVFKINRRFPLGEPIIATDPQSACEYALNYVRGRWPEAEPSIAKNAYWSYYYAKHIIKDRFSAGEPVIMTDPKWACNYAINIIKDRWPEVEPSIKLSEHWWNEYTSWLVLGIDKKPDI